MPTDTPRERAEELARNLRDLGLEPLIVAGFSRGRPKEPKNEGGT
jgi:hypothetical protein